MNKKLQIFILTLLLLIVPSQRASADFITDDSCIAGTSILNTLVNNITTLGLFTAYSANFYMQGAPYNANNPGYCDPNFYGGVTHNPKGCAPGVTNCSSTCDKNGGVTICYQYLKPDLTFGYTCNEAQAGYMKTYLIPPATIQVAQVGDQLCAQFWTILGFQSIGCKYLPDCSQFALQNSCNVAPSCSQTAYQYSRSLIAITGMIVQCINDSINYLFVSPNNPNCTTYQVNTLSSFQDSMRSAVRAALLLYIIIFGIRMTLSGEQVMTKGEFFNFGAKFILVMYFSVGIATGTDSAGNPIYDDGITTIMKPFFQMGSSTLADIVYSAGGNQGLCSYNSSDYYTDPTTGQSFGYLALWDSIDCRLLYYLGFDSSKIGNSAAIGSVAITMLIGSLSFLTLPLAALFSFQIIFAVFCVVFMVFLLSVVIYFVNVTIISMIALAILIYMAPLFVPMALFQQTKSYYDGWLKLMISYALQPMVVAAYIAMMLTIFDQTMFGNCTFLNTSIEVNIGNSTKTIPFFQICDPDNPQSGCATAVVSDVNTTSCKDTIGYKINQSNTNFISSISAIFFTIQILTPSTAADMLPSLITLCLFGYLFYRFADVLSSFAGELTGGPSLGALAGKPTELFDKAIDLAVRYASGGKAGAKDVGIGKDNKDGQGASASEPVGGSGASASKPTGGGGAPRPPVKLPMK